MAAMAVNPRSQASTATGQCLQRYLAATMDFDNNLFTFDVISVITTSSELKHGTRLLYR